MPTTATDIVRSFYAALAAGNTASALGLMADDIEWIAMWPYRATGRGPQHVATGVLIPLLAEWREVHMQPAEFVAEGDSVVSIGRFTGIHAGTGQDVDAGFAHVWTVHNGKLARFRQYIDTLAVDRARAG